MPDTGSGIIYHYCSLEAFKSIIENECLWLCDIRKSNDFRECIYLDQIMLKTLQKRIDALQHNNQQVSDDYMYLQKMKETIENTQFEQLPVYVCSFSHDGDLLSQWRGYADDGFGISLGFNTNSLDANNGIIGAHCSCKDVFYGSPNAIERYCIQCIRNILSIIKQGHLQDISLLINAHIFLNRPFYKSNAFREENEFRIVLLRDAPPQNNSQFTFSKRKYRITNHQLSSYYEFSFAAVKNEFLRKIYLGPKCKVTSDDVRMFLRDCGYQADNIDIVPSEATYR